MKMYQKRMYMYFRTALLVHRFIPCTIRLAVIDFKDNFLYTFFFLPLKCSAFEEWVLGFCTQPLINDDIKINSLSKQGQGLHSPKMHQNASQLFKIGGGGLDHFLHGDSSGSLYKRDSYGHILFNCQLQCHQFPVHPLDTSETKAASSERNWVSRARKS